MNIRLSTVLLAALLAAGEAIPLSLPASAAPSAPQAQGGPRWHRVVGENAFVRSDSSATVAYPVGRLATGALVEVVEERFGWARVRPDGEAFASMHAFIDADATAAAEEGVVRVTARAPLRAANLASREDPARSWKEVARLEPGDRLRLVETVDAEGRRTHKVALPPQASVWVNTAFLVLATPEEVAARTRTNAAPAATTTDGLSLMPSREPPAAAVVSGAGRADPLQSGDRAGDSAPIGADLLEPRTPAAIGEVIVVGVEPRPHAAFPQSASLDDLELVWRRIAEGRAGSVGDLGELRDRYLVLAGSASSSAAMRSRAVLRAEQLRLQEEIQSRLSDLRRLQEQTLLEVATIRETRRRLEAKWDYVAIGRLNASAIYDGQRLPRLFRLQETSEGPTIAYVLPSATTDLATLTGLLVGVAGTTRYDESLRVNLITPVRIDLLADTGP
jgi:hypothetical protein